jgi:hypothetical protein
MKVKDLDSLLNVCDPVIAEAYRFVEDNMETADGHHGYVGFGPYWHGWMLRAAFMAGAIWARQQFKEESGGKKSET